MDEGIDIDAAHWAAARPRKGKGADPHLGSAAFRACVFFAARRGEWLLSPEMSAKFNVEPKNVFQTFRHAVEAGWLTKVKGATKTSHLRWEAGPKLIEAMGPGDEPT